MSAEIESNQIPRETKPSKGRWRWLRAAVILIGLPYVLLVIVFAIGQKWLIYQPERNLQLSGKAYSGQSQIDDVELKAADSAVLHGWQFRGQPNSDPSRKFLVIYFPGSDGCRVRRIDECRAFTKAGNEVLLFDYRGFGDNPGSPSETVLANDAKAVWKMATKELEFQPRRIVLFGEGLGGAVASRLAAECISDKTPPAALVLSSTFTSLPDAIGWRYPALPLKYLILDRYSSIDRIPDITCPILVVHNVEDMKHPFAQGHRLWDAAPFKSSTGIIKAFHPIQKFPYSAIPTGAIASRTTELIRQLP